MAFDKTWEKIFKNQNWGKYPSEDVIRFIASKFNSVPNRAEVRILDIGCGEGFVLKFFKDHAWEIVGVDFSTHGIRANNPELESFIMQGDVYELLI